MGKTGYYTLRKDEVDELWTKAVIVLDTSTLGNLYYMAENPKKTLIDIFGIVKNRLWLPGYVVYEYRENREKFVEKSFEKYVLPKQGVYVNRYEAEMDDFLKENDNETNHPYLESESLEKIKEADKLVREKLQTIRAEIKTQYAKRKASLRKEIENDGVNKLVETLQHGEPFDFGRQMNIVREGELRYRNLIPPGYEDAPPFNSKKRGMQRYGDLIVWKEILEYAKEKNVPVIFVCDDLKGDWYHFKENKSTNIPRHELMKEFQNETGQLFWMYSLKEFIGEFTRQHRGDANLPQSSKLEAVKRVLMQRENKQRCRRYKNGNDVLKINCKACRKDNKDAIIIIRKDEIDWTWECEFCNDREMGGEMMYQHEEQMECSNGHLITVTFQVWEYPTGVVNHTGIECDGGDVIEKFDFDDIIDLNEVEDEDACVRCGYGQVYENSLCVDCYKEYRKLIDRDD